MQLARFLNNIFKKDGFVLIDANSNKYIIGSPKKNDPILRKRDSKFIFINSGFNLRPLDLNAAIASSQLKRINKFL